jgi:hypothetical protein
VDVSEQLIGEFDGKIVVCGGITLHNSSDKYVKTKPSTTMQCSNANTAVTYNEFGVGHGVSVVHRIGERNAAAARSVQLTPQNQHRQVRACA